MSPHDLYQTKITNLLDDFGWYWHHQYNSRQSRSGWLDIPAWRPGRFIVIEVKVGRDNLSAEQYFCALTLIEAGIEVYVWWPGDIDEVEDVISGEGRYTLETVPVNAFTKAKGEATGRKSGDGIPDHMTTAKYRELLREGRI
jgi:hypothetical protein